PRARRPFPADPVTARLEELVGRARHLVYASQTRRGSVVRFFARDYWRLVRSRPVALALSAALVFAPASLAASWALRDRPAAIGLVPGQFRPELPRSEEHTSELQSRVDLVCRLLLEKKKNTRIRSRSSSTRQSREKQEVFART